MDTANVHVSLKARSTRAEVMDSSLERNSTHTEPDAAVSLIPIHFGLKTKPFLICSHVLHVFFSSSFPLQFDEVKRGWRSCLWHEPR